VKSGPFPSCIPRTTLDFEPDFKYLSRRDSYTNFRKVHKAASAWEASDKAGDAAQSGDAGASQAIQDLNLEDVKLKKVQKVERTEVGEQQKGVEREVRQALEPGSPISDLLRCVFPAPSASVASNPSDLGSWLKLI
jgi:hypothetical protein